MDSEGQGSLACCSPCGHKESDKTLGLNNNDKVIKVYPLSKIKEGGCPEIALVS